MKNIRRVEVGKTRGWQVHVQREGEEYTKLFSDSVWGGRERALEAARRHRDRLLKILPELLPPVERLQQEAVREKAWRKLTSTGVKGIGFTFQNGRNGRYPFVQSMWAEDGRRRSFRRSIAKHGLRSALWQCCVALYEGRGETGPEPEEIFEQALPAIEEMVEKHAA